MIIDFEYRTETKYSVRCPKCGDNRQKQGTKSLMVYNDDDGFLRWQCMHPGCEWNERQFMKKPENYVQLPSHVEGNKVWWYRDLDGTPLYGVMRIDSSQGKTYRPVNITSEGKILTKNQRYPDIKGLYNQEDVEHHNTVFVVEGEKAAEAGKNLFKKAAVVTWRGGANNISTADWSLLADKEVYLWPDNDDAGIEAMLKISSMLPIDSCKLVFTEHLPKKADLADNLTSEQIKVAIQNATNIELNNEQESLGFLTIEELKEQHKLTNQKLVTGIQILDNNVFLPASGLIVIEGRTKNGKSTTSINLIKSLMNQGKKVLYVSYEMPSSSVIASLIRSEDLNTDLVGAYQSPKADAILDKVGTSLFVVDAAKRIPYKELVKHLDNPKWKGFIVVIDYLQKMPLAARDRQVALKDAMDGLQVLTRKHGFVALVQSQLTPNRNNPLYDAPREANDIHFSADTVLRVWYKEVEHAHPLYDSVVGNYVIHVLYNRYGKSGQIVGFDLLEGAKLVPTTIGYSSDKKTKEDKEEYSKDRMLMDKLDRLVEALLIQKVETI